MNGVLEREPHLDGQVVVITGASRGIGAATARLLSRRGAAVALIARSAEAIDSIASDVRAEAARRFRSPAISGISTGPRSVTARVANDLGAPTILVNNAGVVGLIGHILDCDPADWARNITVNLLGAFAALRAVLPGMVDRGEGTVINVSSGAAENVYEGWNAYCAGKAGLAMLTRSFHLEYGGRGIRVFGFRPGNVDTGMQGERASGVNPVSRLPREAHAPPEHPARVIAWLCGPEVGDLAGRDVTIRDPDLRRRAGLPTQGSRS
jgi:NAD(P)-dependent dehydrogenase (short-subunit alcohol dehydrogenase family)